MDANVVILERLIDEFTGPSVRTCVHPLLMKLAARVSEFLRGLFRKDRVSGAAKTEQASALQTAGSRKSVPLILPQLIVTRDRPGNCASPAHH